MSQPNNSGMDSGREPMSQSGDADNSMYSRNPITGTGLNGDGVGGLKPKIPKCRMGNPVTGEGYRPGLTDYEVLRKTHRRSSAFTEDRP